MQKILFQSYLYQPIVRLFKKSKQIFVMFYNKECRCELYKFRKKKQTCNPFTKFFIGAHLWIHLRGGQVSTCMAWRACQKAGHFLLERRRMISSAASFNKNTAIWLDVSQPRNTTFIWLSVFFVVNFGQWTICWVVVNLLLEISMFLLESGIRTRPIIL